MAGNQITLKVTGPELEALRSALVNIMEGIMPDADDPQLQSLHDYLLDL